jgi:hypothetical protein
MPEGLPPQYWDASHGLKTEALVKDFVGLKTSADARTASRPEKPELYKAELAADFKLPEGVNIKFDDKDPIAGPILTEARTLAHELGIDQPTFSKLLTLQAKLELGRANALVAKQQVEMAATVKKLGDNFETRKAALDKYISAALSGTEQAKTAKGAAIASLVTSAEAFEALEDLIARANTVIPGTQNNQDPPKPAQQRAADRWYPQKAS